jgi:hypothetical protein
MTTGSIKEMFLQVRVPPSEKDYLRFLWYENDAVVPVLNVRHQAIRLWTDSRAMHDWIRVESRVLQVFVKNSVLKTYNT